MKVSLSEWKKSGVRDERRDYSISKLGKKIEIGSVENGKLRTY